MKPRTNLGGSVEEVAREDRAVSILIRQICEEFSWVGLGRFNTHDAGRHGLQDVDDERECKINGVLLS